MSAGSRPVPLFHRCDAAPAYDEDAIRKHVGDVLRQRRKALHLSQAVIARELGMTKTTICRLEQGQRRSYLDRALPYAHLLDVPYARLFPPRCASSLDRLIQRILAAPPYVHTLFDSILDIPQYGTPAQHVDAS